MPKEEDVFGLRVRIHSRAEMFEPDSPRTLFVVRCSDLPLSTIPEPLRSRNRRTQCDQCHELCWLDPVYAMPGMRICCQRCAPDDMIPYAVDEQVAEARRLFG
jgi:hypothetical protein